MTFIYKTIKTYQTMRFLLILATILSLSACALKPAVVDRTSSLAKAGRLGNTRQALLVTDESILFFKSSKVYALEKYDADWIQALEPMDAVVGRKGFATEGEKREGDGRTPSGIYRMGTTFGYAESIHTKMPYRQALADDLWIDDQGDPDYNRWVKQSQTRALSFEKMRRADNLYQYGIVIEYNTASIVKGHGSAIFFHVWAGAGSTTAGCVAVSEENILKILSWLDPAANPVIIINVEQ
jgi:L,D-peptidoglycan transpeptidase YkuD (ErfK/YbiS/YcfS/YnhG family)